ncbi:MAG: glycosyltransferase [Ardenticatenaceae bacterium]|nr:glycosyltransferase [Anaerolineales bacterium]MCB8921866.1 glycosyltransferase [Ardenticatenaceae bacterium]MCB8990976.1 glycosyltransferase [Ardenticatenaceae bacterium]MCB9005344.1 glycosyltransferase [Ardenticatenaceae bacterium]
MAKISASVGITAHNEEANIGKLLDLMLAQELQTVAIAEILVVASGCTDGTEAIVQEYAERNGRIRLLVQQKREGKASAINLFMREAGAEVLVLSSADLQPEVDVVEKLVRPFADPEMGMTNCRPLPVNDKATFMGFTAHLLWDLHHVINASGGFKAGEMIAFRKAFTRIPQHTAVDEASIEPIMRGQGYQVQYVPQAIVYNKGPDTVADFLRQRRRIYAGHLDVRESLGYAVSTMSGTTVLRALLRHLDWRPRPFAWTMAVVGLEVYGRYLGWRDYKSKRNHTVWEIATTTKELGK